MKNIKNKPMLTRIYFAACLLAFLLVSCMNPSINAPKFNPSPDDLEGDYNEIGVPLEDMQNNMIQVEQNAYQFNENYTGNVYARYIGVINDAWNKANFAVFNAPNNWLNSVFNDQIAGIYSPWFKIKKNEKIDKNSYVWAWAEIIRVAAVHRMTDMYGPIPYSAVKNNEGNLKIAYDNQRDVYLALIEDLSNAIELLSNFVLTSSSSSNTPTAAFDNVYGGDYSKWIKFANSLKLRMAIRMKYVEPALSEKYAKEALNHPVGVLEGKDDTAFLKVAKNPFAVNWGAYKDCRVCYDLVKLLMDYNDPRIDKFCQKPEKGDEFKGIKSGIDVGLKDEVAKIYSTPTIDESSNLLLMPAAEISFLKAECALYGWISESAEELYEKGIKLSFDQWEAAKVDSYLITDAVKWNESEDLERKLERIITQKWLALYPLGNEAWAEQRRTGYPRFEEVEVNASNFAADKTLKTVANRIPYAEMERNNNSENYNKALEILGGEDNYSTKLWWDKKNK